MEKLSKEVQVFKFPDIKKVRNKLEVQVFKLSDIEIVRNKLRYFLKAPSYKFFEKKWSDS